MKFTCEKSIFQKEISVAQEIISSRNAISVVSNVYLEASDNTLIIRATDIKIGFETKIPIDIQENGTCTVFCDKLSAILASIPDGMIEIEHKDNKMLIKPSFKKAQFNLKTISSEQFPQLPTIDDEKYFAVSSENFKNMIQQTIFAVSDDETRYFMNGVFFEKKDSNLIMVATDAKRLAFIKINAENIPEFKAIIIPPKILALVLKRSSNEGQLFIAVNEKTIFVKFGMYTLSSVLIDGQFPNYLKVIPETQKYSVVVKRIDILDALKRVSLFVEQKSRRAFFNLSENKLIISSEDTEIGTAREEIACVYDGPETIIALNYRWLEDPLKVIESENIEILYTEKSRALTIKAVDDSECFHILMPMITD